MPPKPITGALHARLRGSNRYDRAEAAALLAGYGPAVVPLLCQMATDFSGLVRASALTSLGQLAHPGGLPTIVQAVGDPIGDVRQAAIGALVCIEGAEADAALCAALVSKDAVVRAVAAQAVGERRVVAAAPALLALVQCEDSVRAAAIEAVGRVGAPGALEILVDALLPRSNPAVRVAAARGLGALGDPRAIDPLMQALCGPGRLHSVLFQFGQNWILGLIVAATLCWAALSPLFTGPHVWSRATWVLFTLHVCQGTSSFFRRRRSASELSEAVTGAITRIAERTPTPALRTVLPALHLYHLDLVGRTAEARRSCRQAVAQIEAATHDLKHLSLAGPAPETDATQLPVVPERVVPVPMAERRDSCVSRPEESGNGRRVEPSHELPVPRPGSSARPLGEGGDRARI